MPAERILSEIRKLPVIDVHSHLARDGMAPRDLWQVLLYHMIRYPLRATGADENELWPAGDFHAIGEIQQDVFENWQRITHTGFGWALRAILRDLYEFDEPLSAASLPELEKAFEANVRQDGWARRVIDAGGIARILSSRIDVPPLTEGQDGLGVRFTVESAPTAGTREGHTWPKRLAGLGGDGGPVASLGRLRETVAGFYDRFDWSDKRALVSWVSSEADFTPVEEAAVDRMLADAAGGKVPARAESRLLEGAFLRTLCEAIRERVPVFQVCYGVQFVTPGQPHPVAKAAPEFARTFGYLLGEFPEIHFNLLNGFEPDEPILCALCQGYGNVSLASYWWHTFYPSVMHEAWRRRLDMVPTSALCGFFSDGWCIDWTYGRLRLTQRVLANVLAEKVRQGYYSEADAVQVARELLFDSPRRLFLPEERIAE